jgi:phosphoenolpyruvate carboxylase
MYCQSVLFRNIFCRYCGKIDALSQELQSCKRQLILQQKRSERALADLAASAAVELAAAHEHYRIIMNDIGTKMNDMQAQIDAEQNMKRDWTQVQRQNIQSARSHSEKLASLQV